MQAEYYSRTNLSEKRKLLLRSTGSFSIIEDNIVAPTPRKYPNIACSPKVQRRRDKSSDETFKEAGFEIQNILSQGPSVTTPSAAHVSAVRILPLSEDYGENNANLIENISTRSSPKIVTPLRASNPITLNSPFHSLEINPTNNDNKSTTARLYPAVNGRIHSRGTTYSRKELNRGRSLSWPGVPKNYKKLEKA